MFLLTEKLSCFDIWDHLFLCVPDLLNDDEGFCGQQSHWTPS